MYEPVFIPLKDAQGVSALVPLAQVTLITHDAHGLVFHTADTTWHQPLDPELDPAEALMMWHDNLSAAIRAATAETFAASVTPVFSNAAPEPGHVSPAHHTIDRHQRMRRALGDLRTLTERANRTGPARLDLATFREHVTARIAQTEMDGLHNDPTIYATMEHINNNGTLTCPTCEEPITELLSPVEAVHGLHNDPTVYGSNPDTTLEATQTHYTDLNTTYTHCNHCGAQHPLTPSLDNHITWN